jgi:4-carboxymuconolactone decarboxylase
MADSQERLQRGLEVRREVLGDGYVDTALAAATEFTRPIQEYVTQTCWGDVWSRLAWIAGPGAWSTSPC